MHEPESGNAAPSGRHLSPIRFEGLKLRVWPILFAILLALGILVSSRILVYAVQYFVALPDRPLYPWMELSYEQAAQIFVSLIAIGAMKIFMRADYGVHAPHDESYFRPAIFWGIVFGVAMTAIDYWPQIAAHQPPSGRYELIPLNIAGWLSFEGFLEGPSNEVLLRGLLVTYLAAALPGRFVFFRLDMNAAGVIVALIFALTYLGSFVGHPFWIALGQVLLVFAQGAFFAYWLEKSKSLFGPIVGDSTFQVTQCALIFAMVWAWG
jgi:hypothetical protein